MKYNRLREQIMKLLINEKQKGILQAELERKLKFSRSHISETLKKLQNERKVEVRKVSSNINRLWLPLYFPGTLNYQVRIGILRSSEYVIHLSKLMDILEDEKKSVAIRVYESTIELLQDLNQSLLEIVMAPFYPSLLNSLIYENPIVCPVASGGSAIVSLPGEDILYVSETSTMAKFAQVYISSNRNIKMVSMGSMKKNIEQFLKQGGLIALWEPYLSIALKKHGVKIKAKYEELLFDLPCCVITFSKLFYKTRSDLAHKIHGIGEQKSNENMSSEFKEKICQILGFEEPVILRSLESYYYFREYSNFSIDSEKLGIYLTEGQKQEIFPLTDSRE